MEMKPFLTSIYWSSRRALRFVVDWWPILAFIIAVMLLASLSEKRVFP